MLALAALNIVHPFAIALLLMVISVSLGLGLLKISFSWLFYLLVLIFLGGVIVIITYIASLAANEKFSRPKIRSLRILLLAPGVLLFDHIRKTKISSAFLFSGALYEPLLLRCTIFCFLILLLALIRAVKLIKLEEGPLVKRL